MLIKLMSDFINSHTVHRRKSVRFDDLAVEQSVARQNIPAICDVAGDSEFDAVNALSAVENLQSSVGLRRAGIRFFDAENSGGR